MSSSLSHLLKTTFSKPGQEYVLETKQLNMPDDLGTLKKRLTTVIECISKSSITEEEPDDDTTESMHFSF